MAEVNVLDKGFVRLESHMGGDAAAQRIGMTTIKFTLTDYDNCIKVTQDCLVKRGIIKDDRLIVDARIRKFPAEKDRIVVRVEGCALYPDELELPQ